MCVALAAEKVSCPMPGLNRKDPQSGDHHEVLPISASRCESIGVRERLRRSAVHATGFLL